MNLGSDTTDPHSTDSVASIPTAPNGIASRLVSPFFFYGIALGVILLDQGVKAWTIAKLPLGASFPIWPGVFQILHTQNKGMAFSLLEGKPYAISLLAFAAIVVTGVIVAIERRLVGRLRLSHALALALPLGGALGNLIDRVRLGHVTDMFDFRLINFPVFNVADSAITIGVGILIYYNLVVQEPSGGDLASGEVRSAATTDSPSAPPPAQAT